MFVSMGAGLQRRVQRLYGQGASCTVGSLCPYRGHGPALLHFLENMVTEKGEELAGKTIRIPAPGNAAHAIQKAISAPTR